MLQVFCSEPESIIGTLIESPELMDLLFSFLQSPKPLDCTLAGYWARVLQILLVKRSGDVYGFCRSKSRFTYCSTQRPLRRGSCSSAGVAPEPLQVPCLGMCMPPAAVSWLALSGGDVHP